jgi:hypothetical protein
MDNNYARIGHSPNVVHLAARLRSSATASPDLRAVRRLPPGLDSFVWRPEEQAVGARRWRPLVVAIDYYGDRRLAHGGVGGIKDSGGARSDNQA